MDAPKTSETEGDLLIPRTRTRSFGARRLTLVSDTYSGVVRDLNSQAAWISPRIFHLHPDTPI